MSNQLFVSARQIPSGKFVAVVQKELPRRPSDMYHMSPEAYVDNRKVVDVEEIPIRYASREEAMTQGNAYLEAHYLHSFTVRN